MPTNLIPQHVPYAELARQMRAALLAAGVSNLSAGGAARAFGEQLDRQLSKLWDALEEADRNNHISTASDFHLDLFGMDLGLPRLGVGPIRTLQNQRFWVARGVLGDYTGGRDLTLGPGVRVSSASGQHPLYDVIPYQDGSLLWPVWAADQSEIMVPTESVTRGGDANCDAGILTGHNLPYAGILTSNTQAILHARIPESDDSYRYRLQQSLLVMQGSNALAIERAVLELPDADAAIVLPWSQGPGSVTVVVVPAKGAGSPDLAGRAAAKIRRVSAVGEAVYVRLARSRELLISARVRTEQAASWAAPRARELLLAYLGTLNAGESFVVSAAVAALLSEPAFRDAALLALTLDGQPCPPMNINLEPDQILVVPSPATESLQIDVMP